MRLSAHQLLFYLSLLLLDLLLHKEQGFEVISRRVLTLAVRGPAGLMLTFFLGSGMIMNILTTPLMKADRALRPLLCL